MFRVWLAFCLVLVVAAKPRAKSTVKAYEEWQRQLKSVDPYLLMNANKESADLHGFQAPQMMFNCTPQRSPTKPTSAHALRPADIDVVTCFGDSVMAGNGVLADTIVELPLQNRHHSGYGGGAQSLAEGVRTMPNVLKMFNPDLTGYSTDESSAGEPEAGMNVAVPGCTSHCMYDQAVDLVSQLEADEDYDTDWKISSMLIGGNDLCRSCSDSEYYGAERYTSEIQRALDYLHENVPRMLVNLVPMFDITPLPGMSDGIMCDTLQDIFCGCATDDATSPDLKPLQEAYYQSLLALVNTGRYDTREDFTVVLQIGLRDASPPTLPGGGFDRSYWGPDCFHPGTKAHYVIGIQMFNLMLQREGQKETLVNWRMDEPIRCPTAENPYIFTRLNSNQ